MGEITGAEPASAAAVAETVAAPAPVSEPSARPPPPAANLLPAGTAPAAAGPPPRERRPAPEPQAAVPHRRDLRRDVPVPEPPFLGNRVLERIPFRALVPFINENALFKVQWQFRPQGRKPDEYR